ncbi:hypothetical protein [Lignipirellula cremea]|nr:hypothetical protein [Lignipirellula cremea]
MFLLIVVVILVGAGVYSGVVFFYNENGRAGVGIDKERANEVSEKITEEGRRTMEKTFDEAGDAMREKDTPNE